MTTTTSRAPLQAAEPAGAPSSAEIAALIAEAPVPRPTLLKTFNAMMAREFRVLRRNAISVFTRAVMQPLLFVFVFAYVFPKIGSGIMLGGSAGAGAAAARAGLTGRPGVSKIEADGDHVRVFTREPEGVLGELVTAGSAAGLTVRDASQLKPSLETVFLTLTGREYRE